MYISTGCLHNKSFAETVKDEAGILNEFIIVRLSNVTLIQIIYNFPINNLTLI